MYRVIIDVKPVGKNPFIKLRFTGYYAEETNSNKSVKEMKEQCLDNVKKSIIKFDPKQENSNFVLVEFKKVKMNFLVFESQLNKKTEA